MLCIDFFKKKFLNTTLCLLYQAWERQRCVESEKGMMEQKRLGNTEPNAVVELVKTLNNFNWKQAFI